MKQPMYYFGVLIRLERIRQNRDQREVSHGICVPSYLCKIEKGQVCPDEEIVEKLLKKLGIIYEKDPILIKECEKLINEYWNGSKYGMDMETTYKKLQEKREFLIYSKLAIDWLLIEGKEREESYKELEPFEWIMTDRQQGIYYLLKGMNAPLEKRLYFYEKAFDKLKESFALLYIMTTYWELGNYAKVQSLEGQCINLALEEGSVYTLICCYLLLGSSYACLDLEEMMLLYYNRSIHLIQNTNWTYLLPSIYYNIGSVYVSLKKYDEAITYLEKGSGNSFLINQKLALIYIRKGEKEKALIYIENMKEEEKKEQYSKDSIEHLLLEEVIMELNGDYKENPDSIKLIEQLIKSLKKEKHFGYLYFYKDIILEIYCSHRQYKKALEFQYEISRKSTKILI